MMLRLGPLWVINGPFARRVAEPALIYPRPPQPAQDFNVAHVPGRASASALSSRRDPVGTPLWFEASVLREPACGAPLRQKPACQ